MRFIIKQSPYASNAWRIIKIEPEPATVIVEFVGVTKEYNKDSFTNWVEKDIAPLLAGDYCDFLNDKYVDKNFNEEWGAVDVEKRIKYHENQIKLLKSGKYYWNRHGNGVK